MGKDKKSDKKSKKSKKEGLSKQEPVETPFPPTCYDTTEVATSVKLLGSPERHVLLKALIVLDKYTLIKYENGLLLSRLGVFNQLLDLLNSEDIVILRLTLKILDQLLPVPSIQEELLSLERTETVKQIFDIFVHKNDSIILEISSNILAKLCENLDIISNVVTYNPQERLVSALRTSNDVDTQWNCLDIFRSICNLKEANLWIQHGDYFTSKILVCYLKSPIQKIREKALDILVQISSWEDERIHKDMRENAVIDAMLNIVMNVETETNEFIDNAYQVLTNCAKNCEENAMYFVNCVDFFKFCVFVEKFGCRPNHLAACATIFSLITASSPKVRKILFDLSVHETILSLLRSDDPYVVMKVFQSINNMGVNIYCSEAMLTPAVVKTVIDTMSNPKLELVPYKEMALTTIYNFLVRNPLSYKMLVQLKGVPPILRLFQDKQVMANKAIIGTILDILMILSCREESKELLIEKDVYHSIMSYLTDHDIRLATKALYIMNQYVDTAECRQYFMETNGIEKLTHVIQNNPSEYIVKEALLFARNMIVYRQIGMAFLMSGFLPKLKALQAAEICGEGKYQSTIDMMLDLYLPLKFNERGRLEMTDITRDRFYIVRDGYREDFPFLELQDHQKISPTFVMYVADFSCPPAKAVEVDSNNYQLLTAPKPTNEAEGTEEKTKSTESLPHDVAVVSEEDSSLRGNVALPKLYKYVTEPVCFGFLSPDPYLSRYVQLARAIIFDDETIIYCFEHKVKALARLVCNNISLAKQYIKHYEHGYELHQEELKRRLGTNIIPIGYVRIGAMCERALLFKVLADRLSIPCSLVRGQYYVYYNEVFLIDEIPITDIDAILGPPQSTPGRFYCIVDLINNPGCLLKVGTPEANDYVKAKLPPDINREQAEYIHTFCLE